MVWELIYRIIALLLGIGGVLFLLNDRWFQKYVRFWYGILFWPAAFVLALPNILITSVYGLTKFTIGVIVSVISIFLYAVSLPVSYLGNGLRYLNDILQSHFESLIWPLIEDIPTNLVKIATQEGENDLRYDSEERYRNEIIQVRENAKNRLEMGESVLSLAMGGTLLISQLSNYAIFQTPIFRPRISYFIQVYLLFVSVSIIYRVSLLEVLGLDGTEEFSSLHEFDTALSYQQAISLHFTFQMLIQPFIIGSILLSDRLDILFSVIEKRESKDLSVPEVISETWQELRNQSSGEDQPEQIQNDE